jgi:RNA polymerase sigma factor (sigma-70 family)
LTKGHRARAACKGKSSKGNGSDGVEPAEVVKRGATRMRPDKQDSAGRIDRHDLLVKHHALLQRFVGSLSVSREEAEEIVQDVAVVVLRHRATPLEAKAFAGWCYWVVHNLAAHSRRREARRRARYQDDAELERRYASLGHESDPERAAESKQRLAAYVQRLDEAAQNLLFQRFVLEETSEEIATRMKVSPASVRMRISRLVAALRDRD